MRADVALPLFGTGKPMAAKGAAEYYGLVEGLDAIAVGLHRDAVRAGADCRAHHKVDDAKKGADGLFDVVGKRGKKGSETPFHFRGTNVIIATCRCSLAGFSVLRGAPLLKQVQTGALLRMYAVYPKNADGRIWFAGLKKQVTAGPLRHVIPIHEETGLIMISYTDGDDTKFWREKEGRVLEDALHKEVTALFPDRTIPRPVYFRARHRAAALAAAGTTTTTTTLMKKTTAPPAGVGSAPPAPHHSARRVPGCRIERAGRGRRHLPPARL
jgi:hypothetical protein